MCCEFMLVNVGCWMMIIWVSGCAELEVGGCSGSDYGGITRAKVTGLLQGCKECGGVWGHFA